MFENKMNTLAQILSILKFNAQMADPLQLPSPSSSPTRDATEETVDESIPFLPSNPTRRSSKPIRILTILALTFSSLALLFLFASFISLQIAPVGFNLPWKTKEGINGVVIPVLYNTH